MTEINYAGNIIVILANLPEFLRTPVLKKRMMEYFSMSDVEKKLIIDNALEAGPTIPFPNFAKLFKTWLEILTTLSEEQRNELFSGYIMEGSQVPEKLIAFNLDGILEIFLSLTKQEKDILSHTIKNIINNLDASRRRRIMIIIPDNAKKQLEI